MSFFRSHIIGGQFEDLLLYWEQLKGYFSNKYSIIDLMVAMQNKPRLFLFRLILLQIILYDFTACFAIASENRSQVSITDIQGRPWGSGTDSFARHTRNLNPDFSIDGGLRYIERFGVRDLELMAGAEYKVPSLGMRFTGTLAAATQGILLPEISASGEVSALNPSILGLPVIGIGYSSFPDSRIFKTYLGSEFYPSHSISFFSFKLFGSLVEVPSKSSADLTPAFSLSSRIGKEVKSGIDLFVSFAGGEEGSVIAGDGSKPEVRINHFASAGTGGRFSLGDGKMSADIHMTWTHYKELNLNLLLVGSAVSWQW